MGQPIGPIVKVQAAPECWTHGVDRQVVPNSRCVSTILLCVKSQNSADLLDQFFMETEFWKNLAVRNQANTVLKDSAGDVCICFTMNVLYQHILQNLVWNSIFGQCYLKEGRLDAES